MFFRPAFVLRLQHSPSLVTQFDQCRQPLAGHRSIRLELRAAIDDGSPLSPFDLMKDAILADKVTPLANVALGRGRDEGRSNDLLVASHFQGGKLRQPLNGRFEVVCKMARANCSVRQKHSLFGERTKPCRKTSRRG